MFRQPVNEFPPRFLEPEDSLPCLQHPVTCLFNEPVASIPRPSILILQDPF